MSSGWLSVNSSRVNSSNRHIRVSQGDRALQVDLEKFPLNSVQGSTEPNGSTSIALLYIFESFFKISFAFLVIARIDNDLSLLTKKIKIVGLKGVLLTSSMTLSLEKYNSYLYKNNTSFFAKTFNELHGENNKVTSKKISTIRLSSKRLISKFKSFLARREILWDKSCSPQNLTETSNFTLQSAITNSLFRGSDLKSSHLSINYIPDKGFIGSSQFFSSRGETFPRVRSIDAEDFIKYRPGLFRQINSFPIQAHFGKEKIFLSSYKDTKSSSSQGEKYRNNRDYFSIKKDFYKLSELAKSYDFFREDHIFRTKLSSQIDLNLIRETKDIQAKSLDFMFFNGRNIETEKYSYSSLLSSFERQELLLNSQDPNKHSHQKRERDNVSLHNAYNLHDSSLINNALQRLHSRMPQSVGESNPPEVEFNIISTIEPEPSLDGIDSHLDFINELETVVSNKSNFLPYESEIFPDASDVLFLDNFDSGVLGNNWYIPTGRSSFLGRTQLGKIPIIDGKGVATLTLDTYNPTALQPGDSFFGTEIATVQKFSISTGLAFEARVRLVGSVPEGVVASLFSYSEKNFIRDELTFELLGKKQKLLINSFDNYNFYNPGDLELFTAPHLDLASWNQLRVELFPDRVQWLLNGDVIREEFDTVPDEDMNIRLNFWSPDQYFIQGFNADFQPVDRVEHNQSFSYEIDYVLVERLGMDYVSREVGVSNDLTIPFSRSTSQSLNSAISELENPSLS